jgi:hypothetical protein
MLTPDMFARGASGRATLLLRGVSIASALRDGDQSVRDRRVDVSGSRPAAHEARDVAAAEDQSDHDHQHDDVEKLCRPIAAVWRNSKPSFNEVHDGLLMAPGKSVQSSVDYANASRSARRLRPRPKAAPWSGRGKDCARRVACRAVCGRRG